MKKSNQLATRAFFVLTLALTLLFALPAAADSTGNSSSDDASTMLADAATELRVKTALLTKIGWDMLDTDVEARGDHITLLGEADTRANSELAKEVALSVDGVKEVDNKLTMVKKSSGQPVGDAVGDGEREVKDAILESRVKGALIAEMGTSAFDVEVEATDGKVSLRGKLDNKQHRDLALATTKKCSGVDEVIDLLKVAS